MSFGTFLKNLALAGVTGLQDTTWANRPTSPRPGDRIRLTDHRNVICVWNGALWIPQGAWAQSSTTISTNSTSDAPMGSITIPGGLLGPNGTIRVFSLWAMTNNANNKWPRVRLFNGANNIFLTSPMLTTSGSMSAVGLIRNRTATTQVGFNSGTTGIGTNSNPVATGAVDTTTDSQLQFAGQVSVNTDTLYLEGYTVEVFPA